jgi:hypothetical protein
MNNEELSRPMASERSGVASSESNKIRNALTLLNSKIKRNQEFSGNELRLFIKDMESRGLIIPDVPLSSLKPAELRALTASFNSKMVSGGIMPTPKEWTDKEMVKRIADQQAQIDEDIRSSKL